MKQNIKRKELLGRKAYVPASVEVLELSTQSIICQSGTNEDFIDNPSPVDWFVE